MRYLLIKKLGFPELVCYGKITLKGSKYYYIVQEKLDKSIFKM